MKKILLGALVLAVATSAAFVFLKKATVHSSRCVELVPGNTLFFAHVSDYQRSLKRWPQTALAQIWAEPEMQAFLAKPREKAPGFNAWEQRWDQIKQIVPGEAFLAVTSIDGPQPKVIAGFSFSGKKADVAALLAQPHDELKKAWPAGKSDLSNYHGSDIETFTYQDGTNQTVTVAETYHGDWYFIANDTELLHSTIDAASRESSSPDSLGSQALYKKTVAHLPAEEDVVLFSQLGTVTDRLVTLLKASGQTPDPKQIEELKNIQAIAWGTKIEGAQFRDTVFVLSPNEKPGVPMPRNAIALTAPDTVLYFATGIPPLGNMAQAPTSSQAALATILPSLQAMETALARKQLKWSDFGDAFGPEFSTVLDWPVESAQPSPVFALDVRDAAKAKGFVDAFAEVSAGATPWGRKEENGVTIYQGAPAPNSLIPIAPTMAVTDRFLLLGFNEDTVKQGLARLKSGKAVLSQNGAYQEASKTVKPPTASFGYLDLKALFERAYGTFRPFIAMSLAFNAEAGKYLDASKLPGTETISKHLSPSIFSRTASPEGSVYESVGPLTFHQVILGGFGGGIIAAYPMLENSIGAGGGFKLDPKLLQPNSTAPSKPAKRRSPSTPIPPDSQGNSAPAPTNSTPAGQVSTPKPEQ